MTNHKEQMRPGNTKRINALNPIMSITEDYRRGNYYIKHAHQYGTGKKAYFVFKDNPNPEKNWRGNDPLHIEFKINNLTAAEALERCIEWISNRRCFR